MSIMKKIAIFAILAFSYFFQSAFAQYNICGETLSEDSSGSLTILHDSALVTALENYAEFNAENFELEGYRIQIFFDSKREEALKMRKNFRQNYPETPVYLIYEQPFFKLRVGDFRTKIEAQRLLDPIKKDFSSSFIVKTTIDFPKFK